jgi:hypothetical protein
MKNIRLLSICGFLFCANTQLISQVAMPYYTGFDNATQQSGWVEYKTESTQFSNWEYATGVGYSDPNSVGHDYSPSTGITLTDNWFVSPAFEIVSGGQLDSIRYKFTGFSVPEVGDTIAIYLLNGSQDPTLATSKTLLFDFRGAEYTPSSTYKIKSGMNLPPMSGLSYLAIRYRNTDCSSKWLAVSFDNIAINAWTLGVNENSNIQNGIETYPNPSSGYFTINCKEEIQSITIQNQMGEIINRFSYSSGTKNIKIDLVDQAKGIYIIRINQGKKSVTQKLIVK